MVVAFASAVMVWSGAARAANADCAGVQVLPGADLAFVAAAHKAGTTFCINDGSYNVSSRIVSNTGDSFVGVYSDSTRPTISTETAEHVIWVGGASNTTVRDLDISGAVHSNACEPECGRGVGGGSQNLTVISVRAHHNENQGIGGTGPGLVVRNSELDHNGNADSAADGGSISAAGIKSTFPYSVFDSHIHDNYWSGIWCDHDCEALEVHDSIITGNGKDGIHYEISSGPSVIEGNTFSGNGQGRLDWGTIDYSKTPKAGIIVKGSNNVTIDSNTFAPTPSTAGKAVYVATDDRRQAFNPSIERPVELINNTLNADTIFARQPLSCGGTGTSVVCLNNSSAVPTTDTTAPSVTRKTPSAAATGVAVGANVGAVFSEDMDPSTATSSSVRLVRAGTTAPIAAAVGYDRDTRTATLDPTADLAANTTYKATVNTGVRDLAGNPMAKLVTWQFATGATP